MGNASQVVLDSEAESDVGLECRLPGEALRLLAEAESAERSGKRRLARERYNAVLPWLDRNCHAWAAAAVMRHIGRVYVDERNFDAALDSFASAIAISGGAGDTEGVSTAFQLMAQVYRLRGESEHSELLARFARLGRPIGRQVA
jgi:hypothetical protein